MSELCRLSKIAEDKLYDWRGGPEGGTVSCDISLTTADEVIRELEKVKKYADLLIDSVVSRELHRD